MAFKRERIHDIEQARAVIRKYCAYQERCHQEVYRRLKDMGLGNEAVETLIGELVTEDYLSETRFAALFVRSKWRQKHWGRRRLRLELQKRAINDRLIQSALAEIDDDAYNQALQDLIVKWLDGAAFTAARRQDLWQFLLRKGYESHLIEAALKALELTR